MPSSTCVIAKKLIDGFKAKHPHIKSSSRIAQLIGIKQSSINRIENLNTNPSYELLTDIVIGTGNQHRLIEVLGEVNPKLQGSFQENLKHLKNYKPLSPEVDELLTKEEFCFTLLLAYTQKGTSREEVVRELGAQGDRNLNRLIQQGILAEDDAGYIKPWTQPRTYSQATIKKMFQVCLDKGYREELFGLGENWCSFQTEVGDREEAMKFVRETLQDAFNKIKDEFGSGKFKTKDPSDQSTFFIGMVADTIDTKPTKEVEVQQ
jgi:transcriptional regulator with XRE-family HTH domain